jgi:hypothetical protein
LPAFASGDVVVDEVRRRENWEVVVDSLERRESMIHMWPCKYLLGDLAVLHCLDLVDMAMGMGSIMEVDMEVISHIKGTKYPFFGLVRLHLHWTRQLQNPPLTTILPFTLSLFVLHYSLPFVRRLYFRLAPFFPALCVRTFFPGFGLVLGRRLMPCPRPGSFLIMATCVRYHVVFMKQKS